MINLPSILTQSKLRSLIFRKIHSEIQAAVNGLQAQLDASLTPPAGSEVTNARDFHSNLRDRLRSGFSVLERYMVSGGVVAQDTGFNMKVTVAAGQAVVAGIGCTWGAMTSGVITPDPTDPRWDTVVINSDATVSIVQGLAAPTPDLPTISSAQKKLAHILITAGMTQIVDADIFDARTETKNSEFLCFEPIGTIKAWHKSFTNTPAIKKGDAWKECDGSMIDDPESPYYGQMIDDLNGGARFLKGAATSGALEASTNKAHDHTGTVASGGVSHDHGGSVSAVNVPHDHGGYTGNQGILKSVGGGTEGAPDSANGDGSTRAWQHNHSIPSDNINHYHNISGDAATHAHTFSMTSEGAAEALPKNMSVVWIMRIK